MGRRTLGLVGARGFVGSELVRLLDGHQGVQLEFVVSRGAAGTPVAVSVPQTRCPLVFENLSPQQVVDRGVDVVVLALGNGEAQPFVTALDQAGGPTTVVDISADHRFDDAWAYGLPEHFRDGLVGAKRIANPGCYATAAQVALRPVLGWLQNPPSVFGVSGYSGAGSTPSPRNDPQRLEDNLVPYALVGHTHEKEITHHLKRDVAFMPHVAPFFRGLAVTVSATFVRPVSVQQLADAFGLAYAAEPLVRLQREPPEPRAAVGKATVTVGGFAVDESRCHGVWVAALDNLLKGAASQALQNVNLALGLPETAGLTVEDA